MVLTNIYGWKDEGNPEESVRTIISFSRRKGMKQMDQHLQLNGKTAKTLPLCVWGYRKCSFNEELFNYIMEQRFANAQQWTCWQLNRKEFISGSRIVLAAYSFPAEGLQITLCLCEVAQLCQPAIPAAPNIAGAAPPSSDSHMPGNLRFAAPNTLAATKAFPG